MKLYLDSNIVEGTPEELVTYQELLKERGIDSEKSLFHFGHMHQPTEEEEFDAGNYSILSPEAQAPLEKIEEEGAPMGYTFWYIDGTQGRRNNVLKASLEGYFEDSTGTRYTYQAVSGLIKPITNEYARQKFEEARYYGYLLKYYSTVDEFTMLKH